MKKLFTLLLVLIACSVSAIDMGPYDTGAARKSDLGTMAVEAATDYVATDTFTGHTDATGSSVHGLGTISTFASTDYVATSSLAERLDTTNASITGDIDVTGDVGAATLGITGHSTLTTASATALTVTAPSSVVPLVYLEANAAAQVASTSTDYYVDFTTEIKDSANAFSNASFSAPISGIYLVFARVSFAANATGMRYVEIEKNENAETARLLAAGEAASSGGKLIEVSSLLYLSASDRIRIRANQTSGGDLGIEATFSNLKILLVRSL